MSLSPLQRVAIRRARFLQGISQVELARRVGCSPSQICKFESGTKTPSPDLLERIVLALNLRGDS